MTIEVHISVSTEIEVHISVSTEIEVHISSSSGIEMHISASTEVEVHISAPTEIEVYSRVLFSTRAWFSAIRFGVYVNITSKGEKKSSSGCYRPISARITTLLFYCSFY